MTFADESDRKVQLDHEGSVGEMNKKEVKTETGSTHKRFSAKETIFIFDWDDTVMPWTWVQSEGLRIGSGPQPNTQQRALLSEVAKVASETLEVAKKLGHVVLVTNAEDGWIELSCRKYMPSLYPVLENVKMRSARSTFESPDLVDPVDWKCRAFAAELEQFFGISTMAAPTKKKNILSIGDGLHERSALLHVTKTLPNCRSKALKFVERPGINQMCQQHMMITRCFDRIVDHDGNLDLNVQCA